LLCLAFSRPSSGVIGWWRAGEHSVKPLAFDHHPQDGRILGPVMFQADDLSVAIMPEAYAVSRLGRELMPMLFWKE
jgi:hypothetical protein